MGSSTDVCILTKNNNCRFFSEEDKLINKLNGIYINHINEQKEFYTEKILPELKKVNLGKLK